MGEGEWMGGGLGVLSGPRLEESFTSKRFRGSFCDTFGSGTLPREEKGARGK